MAQTESPERLLRRLHWKILRPLGHALGGNERSLVRGLSTEVEDLREYQPGDDVRYIDWNVTARAEAPYVRLSRLERAIDVWLVVDVSDSANWGTARCLKKDLSAEFVAVASTILGRNGNRVGALMFADRPLDLVQPAGGRVQHLRLLSSVRESPAQARKAPTDLTAALARADSMMRRKSLVLVVSDFLAPQGWQAELRRMSQRHEVIAVHIADPRERALPDVGLVTLEDPETGAQLTVNTSDRKLRERFRQAAEKQAAQIRADAVGAGAGYVSLSTGEEMLPALVGFLNARRLGTRGGSHAAAQAIGANASGPNAPSANE